MSHIKTRIAELRVPEEVVFKATAADVTRRLWDVATADMRDLVRLHVGPCRYCHGVEHQFQCKSEREYMVALSRARNALGPNAAAPDPSADPSWPSLFGGSGYRLTRTPHPDCPECSGLGEPYVAGGERPPNRTDARPS